MRHLRRHHRWLGQRRSRLRRLRATVQPEKLVGL